ncbi:MAG TPA: tail fiber domain-containing protein [Ignavibacteria bacterium]|nr:tail fiber domain-containing protein [Ignavibacteria bacterium]
MRTKLFIIALFILLFPILILGQNCEVVVKLPTSNTTGNCGFTIKDSVNNVILRENAIGALYLNMPPNVGGVIHEGEILSINRGPVRLFSAGYYLPENIYYIDIPSPVKITADFLEVNELHGINNDTINVDGLFTVNRNMTVNAPFRLNDDGCYTGSWTQCSDLRLKKNIGIIDNALNKILTLQGVNYEWKCDEFPSYNFSRGMKIGLIAQNVEQVFPELVKTDSEGMKSVDYSNMTAVLIEAVKQQQEIIDDQKRTIENLENRISKIESIINEIQNNSKERSK